MATTKKTTTKTAEAAPDPKTTLEASKEHAKLAAEELRTAASLKANELKEVAREKAHDYRDTAEEKAADARHYAEDQYHAAHDQVDELREETERYIRANPLKSVLVTLGVGFFIGRFLR